MYKSAPSFKRRLLLTAVCVMGLPFEPSYVQAQENGIGAAAEGFILNLIEGETAEVQGNESQGEATEVISEPVNVPSFEGGENALVPIPAQADGAVIMVDPANVPKSLLNANAEAEKEAMVEKPEEASAAATATEAPVPLTPEVKNSIEENTAAELSDVPMPLTEPVVAQDVAPPAQNILAVPRKEIPKPIARTPSVPAPVRSAPVQTSNDLFFDSQNSGPRGQIAKKAAITKVNPNAQPASKYVIVNKNYKRTDKQAQLVSAERALGLGRYEAAYSMFSELYEKNNTDPAVLMGRALSLQNLGRDQGAMQAYQQLLDVKPGFVDAEVNMLGIMGKRYPAVATRRLMELQDANPNNVSILAQLAVVSANTGRYEDALKYLGIATGYDPRNANHLYNMAVISDLAGQPKDAVIYYERSLEVDSIHGGGRSIPRQSVISRLTQLR